MIGLASLAPCFGVLQVIYKVPDKGNTCEMFETKVWDSMKLFSKVFVLIKVVQWIASSIMCSISRCRRIQGALHLVRERQQQLLPVLGFQLKKSESRRFFSSGRYDGYCFTFIYSSAI